MKTKQLTLNSTIHNSFSIRRDIYPKHHNSWHYHEEIELVMIYKGTGSLYLGDTIKDFSEGNCILIGSNIPHFWLFHNLEDENQDASIDCIVIHFHTEFAGANFFNTAELETLKKLIQDAEKGLLINHSSTTAIKSLFIKALEVQGLTKFITLLKILDNIHRAEKENIVSDNYSILNNTNDEKRMRSVMSFIQNQYTFNIDLSDLSNEAKMTKNSFCRYFKQKTGKSPTQFINELRVAHACRLLRNTQISLKEICFDSGFNNFVSFHKIFKEQVNTTPKQFRKEIGH